MLNVILPPRTYCYEIVWRPRPVPRSRGSRPMPRSLSSIYTNRHNCKLAIITLIICTLAGWKIVLKHVLQKMQSNKTCILYVVFIFHMKTSRQNCRLLCLVTEPPQPCDTSAASCSIQTKHYTIILYSLDKYGWAWAQVILGGNPRLVRGGDDMVRVWREAAGWNVVNTLADCRDMVYGLCMKYSNFVDNLIWSI